MRILILRIGILLRAIGMQQLLELIIKQLNHRNDNKSLSDKKKQVFSLAIQHILFIFALVTGVV